jgi:hypothetical protein
MSPPANAGYLREQYEILRREAMAADPFGPRGHGLALFMTRGLPAWLAAVQRLSSRADGPAELSPRAQTDRLPWRADDRANLTRILASLVVTCAQPEVARA